jgi:hypothetical protein
MTKRSTISLSEHMRRAVKARWAKTTAEERSAHARKMVEARESIRQAARNAALPPA